MFWSRDTQVIFLSVFIQLFDSVFSLNHAYKISMFLSMTIKTLI